MISEDLMVQLRKACDAEFEPEEAFRSSGLNQTGSADKAREMYLSDRAQIEKRQPEFYEGHSPRFDAYVKFMLKRLQYGLEIPEWKIDD